MPRGFTIYDEANLQRRLWTPSELPSSRLALWFDVSDPISLDLRFANYCTTWRDKSGNDKHATQSDSQLMPIRINKSGINFLSFDGSGMFMSFPQIVIDDNLTSIFSVYERLTTGIHSIDISGDPSVTNGYANWIYTDEVTYSLLRLPNYGSHSGSPYATGIFLNSLIRDDSGTISYRNGVQYGTAQVQSNSSAASFSRIGKAESSAYHRGLMGEIIMVRGGLTIFERQKIEGYLGWKWNINNNLPSSHPFFIRPPFSGD